MRHTFVEGTDENGERYGEVWTSYDGDLTPLIDYYEAIAEYEQAKLRFTQRLPSMIKDIRKSRKLTQQEFADLTGVHFTYISKIESGHVIAGMPFLRKVFELVEGKNTPEWVIKEDNE